MHFPLLSHEEARIPLVLHINMPLHVFACKEHSLRIRRLFYITHNVMHTPAVTCRLSDAAWSRSLLGRLLVPALCGLHMLQRVCAGLLGGCNHRRPDGSDRTGVLQSPQLAQANCYIGNHPSDAQPPIAAGCICMCWLCHCISQRTAILLRQSQVRRRWRAMLGLHAEAKHRITSAPKSYNLESF